MRLQADSDTFIVNMTTYSDGRAHTTEVEREYADLTGNQVETYEVNASSGYRKEN